MTPEQLETRMKHELEQHWAEWRTIERKRELYELLEMEKGWFAWNVSKTPGVHEMLRKLIATVLAELHEREQAEGGDE